MRRLQLKDRPTLPPWTRIAWASDVARSTWEERIKNINAAWARVERWSVVDGARSSCLTFVEPRDLPVVTRWAEKHDLVAMPLARVGISDQYSARSRELCEGEAWQYRVVITKRPYVKKWYEAWEDTGEGGKYRGTNNRVIGELLGFPSCCIDFFERVWVDEEWQDTTWPMTQLTADNAGDEYKRTIVISETAPIATNILLRWLGVRVVPHLPCHHHCQATVGFAEDLREVAIKRDFARWWDHASEMLSWPVEWSALHGIAEIKTPILKISSNTDVTAEKYVVRRHGPSYPDEGVAGRAFPYRDAKNVKLYEHRSFKDSLAAIQPPTGIRGIVTGVTAPDDPTEWTDNGFSSREAMDQAHNVIVDVIGQHRDDERLLIDDPTIAIIIDLGCGNGRLLQRIITLFPAPIAYGIEQDRARARRAYERLPLSYIRHGEMFDLTLWPDDPIDLALVMPGRFIEGDNENTLIVARDRLMKVRYLLFYAYGDWLNRCGGIEPLVREAGFDSQRWQFVGAVQGTHNVEAVLATVAG